MTSLGNNQKRDSIRYDFKHNLLFIVNAVNQEGKGEREWGGR